MKYLFILHRYLGVVVGLIMLMWCLSGFVMMYQSFPDTTQDEVYAGRDAINLADCCALDHIGGADDEAVPGFEIRMRAGVPVLSMGRGGAGGMHDLTSGQAVSDLSQAEVRGEMQSFIAGNNLQGEITSLEPIVVDQWSVYMWKRAAPLWKAELNDRANTYLYVSGASGEVVQDANGMERFLSWFGAIPHWLYPQLIRQNQPLWYQTVIWLTVVGIFLTVTGLFVGILRLRKRKGRWSPYKKPFWLWHHLGGTIAGLLVLTWAVSGLLTMQPWGLLESEPTTSRSDLTGEMTWGETRRLIAGASDMLPEDVVSIRSAPFAGTAGLKAVRRSGEVMRLTERGVVTLTPESVEADLVARGLPVSDVAMLTSEDAYYYGHKTAARFPVLRVQLADGDRSRAYIDPASGELVRFVTATGKRYRWLENGFHNFDWPVIQERPIWDVLTIILMLAVTLVCGTGAWLSISRVRRDLRMMFRKPKRRRAQQAAE